MNPVLVLNERDEGTPTRKTSPTEFQALNAQTVLIATIDHDIRAALMDLLEGTEIEVVSASSVKDVKALLARKKISACLCGFWLQDGTYREVVRHLRRERMDIPAIIVSVPTCPQEFREYLAAMNLGGLDVLSYPFEKSEFDRMLEFALPSKSVAIQQQQATEEVAQFEVRGAA